MRRVNDATTRAAFQAGPALAHHSSVVRWIRHFAVRRLAFGTSRPVVGLDIGSSAIKAVELRAAGSGYCVAAFGTEPVPPDSIVDGVMVDARGVADAICRMFERNTAFTATDACVSLSGHAVIVKTLTLPVMTESDLDESVRWEVEQCAPFDVQELHVDYQVLDSDTSPEGRESMHVLLVAARKERIRDYAGVVARAGRTPVTVDVDVFALQNAYHANYGFDAGEGVVLLNVGASAININILRGGQSVLTRDIPIGGRAYTEAVQRALDLSRDAAERLKKGIPVDGATVDEVRPLLRAVTEDVLVEIQKTFDFFSAPASANGIDRIVLSGGASRVDGFRRALEDRFGTPVTEFDPFRTITWGATMPDACLRPHAPPRASLISESVR